MGPEGWAKKVDAKIAKLLHWKEHGDLPEVPDITVTPSFTQKIMRKPLPPNFKLPSVKRFDGLEDPQEHIMAYQATMTLVRSSEATMCKAFFCILAGRAQQWFTNLNGAEESLTEFLVHWRKEEADVENLDDKSAIVMFIDALKAGELFKSLRRKTPCTYVDLMAKVDRYAEAEEANRLKGGREENLANKPQGEEPVNKKGTVEKNPLNKGKECQLVKPTEQGYVAVPDQGKYCRYHRRYGHSTDECQAWIKEIEALVQSGQLGNYIDWNRMNHGNMWRKGPVGRPRCPTPSEDEPAKESTDMGKCSVINVIFGGWSPVGAEEEYVGSVEESHVLRKQR
ncbi:uncharacterized protein LOC115999502 [Ipomoea triloba]|uniref:uncharacterized protein LOC115999502 n=1 Tax=Ipomoea triloba TaxID=35885 RepID=UPI00125DB9DC|nr:uncharacterized protein LOC115999502 [Ipomoea triloba]